MKPQAGTSPSVVPHPLWSCAVAAVHLCVLCPGVSQSLLLIPHGMVVQELNPISCESQAQLEE